MYQYHTLEATSWEQMAECFNLAFSDYYFAARMTPQQLRSRLEASGTDLSLSCGAFEDGRMVGFIFNAAGDYSGRRAAFDVGTGVVPDHRGKGIFADMLGFVQGEFARGGVQTCCLEVLQQNQRAIRLYQSHGFTVEREYVVLGSPASPAPGAVVQGKEMEYSRFDSHKAADCLLVKPSFEHSTGVLKRNEALYRVRYRERQGRISAFCVYSRESGAVLQLGYAQLEDLAGIVQGLAEEFPSVTAKNIDAAYPQVLEMFRSLGFREVARQFEMRKEIL